MAALSDTELGGETFIEYQQALYQLDDMQSELETLAERTNVFSELVTHLLLTVLDPDDNEVVQNTIQHAAEVEEEKEVLVSHEILCITNVSCMLDRGD